MQIHFLGRVVNAVLLTLLFSLTSCDDEISDFGSEVLLGTEIVIEESVFSGITTSEINTGQVRANNLSYNVLGRFESNNYTANYNIFSQVYGVTESFADSEYTDDDGEFTTTITYTLESAELVIPYRYTLDEIDTDDETETYVIDSEVNGADDATLSINVYRSNFRAFNTDPQNANTQIYYSDGTNLDGEPINTSSVTLIGSSSDENNSGDIDISSVSGSETTIDYTEEDNDVESCDDAENDGYTIDGTLEDDEKWKDLEAIRISLNDEFLNDFLIPLLESEDLDDDEDTIEISSSVLSDSSIYEDFPGIYIEVQNTSTGVIEVMEYGEGLINAGILLNFTKETVVDYDENVSDEEDTCEKESFYSTILMNTDNGRAINIIEKEVGEENTDNETILLQSGQGSVGLLRLFDEEFVELNEFAEENFLLNDAELILTVNQESSFFDSDLFDNKYILGSGDNDSSVPLTDDDNYDEDSDLNYCNVMITLLANGNTLSDYTSNSILDTDDIEASLQQEHLIPLSETDEGDLVFKINITEYLASVLDRDAVDDDELEDLISEEALQLVISPTNDVTLSEATRVKDVNGEDGGQLFEENNIFVNQGTSLSFETIPIYSSEASDESKRPRIILKYTSTTN